MNVTVITGADALSKALANLFEWADNVDMAFAWAGSSMGAARHWQAMDIEKIKRAAIGIAFAGTEPAALRSLHDGSDRLRIVHDKAGTYHPKVLLGKRGRTWRAIVGSANLTAGAYTANTEICVVLEGASNAPQMLAISAFIRSQWRAGKRLDPEWLLKYEKSFKRARAKRETITVPPLPAAASSLETLSMSWDDYLTLITAQEDRLAKIGFAVFPAKDKYSYFEELETSALLFRKKGGFARLSKASCTFLMGKGESSGLLGSMGGAGAAMHIAQNAPAKLSAIDNLPSNGAVPLAEVRILLEALTKPRGVGLGVASRLLAAKRPDLFVSINRGSEPKLSEARSGRRVRSIPQYLTLLDEIWSTDWHRSKRPTDLEEGAVWRRRAALLDAALYETVPSR